MDRRRFCRLLAAGVGLAGLPPWLSGCGRLLSWSEESQSAADRRMASSPESGPTTSTGPGAGEGTTSTDATTAGTTPSTATTAAPTPPDLAVFRGDVPGANVRAAVAALGGIERFVKRGARVVIKPNVLTGRAPEYAATTNPEVVGTLVTLCFEAGAADVTVLDRPTGAARPAFQESGIAAAVAKADGRVKYLSDRNFETVAIPHGRFLTAWPLVSDVFEADVFINVPIAKHHSMAGCTMAMKNLMGIMGGQRGVIHVDFAQKIVDVNTLVRPHLVVLDAYRVLVRNGPTGGDRKDIVTAKTVVAGTSQVSVDAYGTRFFGRRPEDFAFLRNAKEQGLGETDLRRVRIVEGRA